MDAQEGTVAGFVAGLILSFGMILIIAANSCVERSHRFLGSKGAPCFANHTCREGLICLYGEGAEPGTCAKTSVVGR